MTAERVWRVRPSSPLADKLASEADLTPLTAQLLANRGILDPGEALAFLQPRLANLADPMQMKGMEEAAGIITEAIEGKRTIAVYGDYDADGLTASALLVNFLGSLGASVLFYIPHRLKEGYGLNEKAVEEIARSGTRLLVTVDCGVSNEKEVRLAQRLGMQVVVTDHHRMSREIRFPCPMINPTQADCRFAFKELAGVGVAFFLAVGVRAALRRRGGFAEGGEPDLREYLDLVALGTVADRVPLRGQNRILVDGGIARMHHSRWEGLKAMAEAAELGPRANTQDLAFRLVPRLNAPGRMGRAEICMQILTETERASARSLAGKLDAVNALRQRVEKRILGEIQERVQQKGGPGGTRTLVVAGKEWHHGVLGIVASKLVDAYHRPSLVLNVQDGKAVGSGRSIAGFDLFAALTRMEHVFEKFGGHAQAAGFTLQESNVALLRKGLEDFARQALLGKDLRPGFDVDCEVPLDRISPELVQELDYLAPFGEANPEPLFLARSVPVLESRVVGGMHLKMRVGQGKDVFEAIGFGMGGLHPLSGKQVDFLYTPEMNHWQGSERLQLRLVDVKA